MNLNTILIELSSLEVGCGKKIFLQEENAWFITEQSAKYVTFHFKIIMKTSELGLSMFTTFFLYLNIQEEYKIDPVAHLIPVCPNCHNMIHKRKPPFSIDEFLDMIKSTNNNK